MRLHLAQAFSNRAPRGRKHDFKDAERLVRRLIAARAYAMAGDSAKAKSAYQDFLTLWKDADPDIPILIVTHNGRFLAGSQEKFPQPSPRAAAVQIL